jgi:hypothetical protein
MSFIKESYLAYKKVQEVLEKETSDHEIAMARSELEGIADKATATSSMLEGMTESGNPLPAWVQSKITNASDYITSVHDYLKYNPQINESVSLEETTFEKIYQMQQDGKSVEDIAKELNLKADLVKKVLGESKTISEGLSDAQISQLKKEYEPLKGKTITTSQYQQLKNILFKLQDGDLEKLQKQNIPFASTGAGSILRVRKAPVKITSVKVPGLEGMAEEKIDLQEKPSRKKHVVFKVGDKLVAKDFRGYNDDEIAKSIDDFLKQNSKSIVVQQSPIQSVTEEPNNPYAIGMAAAMKATGDTPPLKKSTITKAHKIADKVKEEEVKESHFPVNTQVLYKGKKAQIVQVKEPQVGNYYVVKLDSGENAEASHQDLSIGEEIKESTNRNINEGARALVEAIAALQKKADKSGMPYSILKQVYDRGMAAWKGGHRPGAGQHQWAFARVNSFVTKSSGTWGGADSDLAKKVKGKE